MLDLAEILRSAHSSWTPSALKETPEKPCSEQEALAAWRKGFAFEGALAAFQSGARRLGRGEELPTSLGRILTLEGFAGEETRILRHLQGREWRLTILREGEGSSHAREILEFPGDGPAVGWRLTYHRFWALKEDGEWRPKAVRLADLRKGAET